MLFLQINGSDRVEFDSSVAMGRVFVAEYNALWNFMRCFDFSLKGRYILSVLV